MTMSDAKKKPATESGRYVVVWQKQADGAWKVVLDAPVSDGPAAAAK
jgi:ketosteroid isomerase-like protein